MGEVFRPRAWARLFVPNVGTMPTRVQQEKLDEVTELNVRVAYCRLVSNSHNHADECEIITTYDDAGLDPRFLRSAEMYFYLGDLPDAARSTWGPTFEALRFIGIATIVERMFDESGGKMLRIVAHDYTTLFLNARHYPPEGIPQFSDTLTTAWARVCDHTGYLDLTTGEIESTVQRLRDRIVFIDCSGNTPLGSAVSARLAKLGTLQPQSGAQVDAWAIWQTAVGSLGLISFIRGDRCVVTTATDYYTAANPPRMIYGKNIHTITETRDAQAHNGKNVGIISLNPLTMRTIESFYPPLSAAGQGKVLGKKKTAASALKDAITVRSQDYEIFDCPMPITDQRVLDLFAQRVWEERTRQEMRGHFTTREMRVGTLDGSGTKQTWGDPEPDFDMLMLQAGDRIRVEIDQAGLTLILKQPTDEARKIAAIEQGYSHEMADYIVKNLSDIVNVSPEFQVHEVETTLDVRHGASATYEMRVQYLNRIEVTGSSAAGSGDGTSPMTGQK